MTSKAEANMESPKVLSGEQRNRAEFLNKVKDIVNNNRNSEYGGAEDSFFTIAFLWNAYLQAKPFKLNEDYSSTKYTTISLLDVALMMDLLKTTRLAVNPLHLDSWLDKAGYSTCEGSLLL